MMLIKEIMSANLIKVDMDATLETVRNYLNNHNFHHILVTDKDLLLGIVSDRDILRWITPALDTVNETRHDRNILRKRVHQIMTRHPVTVTPTDRISEAARKILTSNVSCLPVIDESNQVIGIVSWKDLLKCYIESDKTM